MATRERNQNPVIGDNVILRFFSYSSNAPSDVFSIVDINLYFLDPTQVSETNPDGRRLVQVIPASSVSHDGVGQYSVTVPLLDSQFTIGSYLDVWDVVLVENQPEVQVTNEWKIFSSLWFISSKPIVYSFEFALKNNKFRKGSKRYLIIDVRPNVPTASDLEQYYNYLITVSPITISIEMECGQCIPAEQDLRLIVDQDPVVLREKCEGYYFLDTVALEMDCGVYNVWFEMQLGESLYISEKQQLQIF